MQLTLFDMDNTLLAGDSDHAWGRFIVDEGLVDAREHAKANDFFHAQYRAGALDIHAFQRFTLSTITTHPAPALDALRARFVTEHIKPMVAHQAIALLEYHRKRGDAIAIVTATNRFIAEPIARLLGVNELIATEPEIVDGAYTGNIAGTPAYREGKIERARALIQALAQPIDLVAFYSDSHNDLPLLRWCDRPVAVDPDETLADEARVAGWPIISLNGCALTFANGIAVASTASA